MKQYFVLSHDTARKRALQAVQQAQEGDVVTVAEPTRSGEQNALFHSICGDVARAGIEWAGKRRSADEWKVLLVSGHAVATKSGSDIVPGLEGEFVNLRESTASMTRSRGSSLIEYAMAFLAQHETTA